MFLSIFFMIHSTAILDFSASDFRYSGAYEGITWTTHKVIGFTPKYLKIEPDDWTKKFGSKDYQLIMPFNSLVINEEDAKYLED